MDYEEWNKRLLGYFFNPGKRHRRVRLSIDPEKLSQLGGDCRNLALATVDEANRRGCSTVQDFALHLHESWERRALAGTEEVVPPPFLAVLVLYVIAVNYGGDEYPAHAYYDRLHSLLDGPQFPIKSIEPSLELWQALEDWSVRRMAGSLGYFEGAVRGGQAYVGIPRRQGLLAPQEEGPLRLAFRAAGLRPGSNPGDTRLVTAARDADGLLTRTKRLLRKWPDDELSRELLEEIRANFEDWDVIDVADAAATGSSALMLRLVLRSRGKTLAGGHFEADAVAGVTDQEHRLSVKAVGVPAVSGSLWLQTGDDSGRPLVVDDNGDPSWAKPSLWFTDVELAIEETSFALVRTSHRFLLMKPRGDGMLEEVDDRDLVTDGTYLFVTQDARPSVIPPRFRAAHSEWLSSPDLPGVFHRAVHLVGTGHDAIGGHRGVRLTGGIPSGSGRSAFMSFAPPSVTVTGLGPSETCVVRVRRFDGRGRDLGTRPLSMETTGAGLDELDMDGARGDMRAEIPAFSAETSLCEVEVAFSDGQVSSIRCFIESCPDSVDFAAPIARNGLGEPSETGLRCSTESGHITSIDTHGPLRIVEHARRPVRRIAHVEDSAGLLLMRLLRARGSITWQRAKDWLPRCLPDTIRLRRSDNVYLIDQVLALHSLGVVELEESLHGGLERLVALPPCITLLPRLANCGMAGSGGLRFSYEAVLLGCWLPDELARVAKAARRSGVELLVLPREEGVPMVPHRRSLLVEGDAVTDRLRRVAGASGVRFLGSKPAACHLVESLSSIDQLIDQDGWLPGVPAAVYVKRFFDPAALGVVRDDSEIPGRFVLCECRERNWWRYFIVDRETGRHLRVHDRQLGRWFVRRRAFPDAPLPVSDGDLFVPFELRLPRVLERAIVFSSGRAPRLKRFRHLISPFNDPAVSEMFRIPAPPERPVDWLASRAHCTGNFCCYAEAVGTAAWPWGRPMPMLGALAKSVRGLGLER